MIRAHGVTHPGRVRSMNEDALAYDIDFGLFIVADGMGGHNAGEVASSLAVETIRSFISRSENDDGFTWPFGIDPLISYHENRVSTAVKLANRRVFKASESREEYTGMGTTVVMALVYGNQMVYSSIGDSRIYSCAQGKLQQITRDDSWVTMILDQDPAFDPALMVTHPMRHVLTNVIGARDQTATRVATRTLVPSERLLFCSDGLHGALEPESIRKLLGASPTLEETAETLVREALEKDGKDNITALIVEYSA